MQIRGNRSPVDVEAAAITEAIIDAAATVEVCGECSVAAALWGRSYEEILINATTEPQLQFARDGLSGFGKELIANNFVEQVVTTAVDATIEVRPCSHWACHAVTFAHAWPISADRLPYRTPS